MRLFNIKSFVFLLFIFNLSCVFAATNSSKINFDLTSWSPELQMRLLSTIKEFNKTTSSEEDLNDLIKFIYKKTQFKKLRIVQNNDKYSILGELNSKFKKIEFIDLSQISEEEALEIINFGTIDLNSASQVQTAIDKLTNYYKNQGFQKIQIKTKEKINSQFEKIMQFKIELGPQTTIQKINFLGINQKEDIRYLKSKVYWSLINQRLTDDILKKTSRDLRRHLNELGYFLEKNLSPQIIYNSDDTAVELNYRFSNTPKYKIKIKGQTLFSEYKIKNSILQLPKYTAADDTFIDELKQKIISEYIDLGYDAFEVKSQIIKNIDSTTVVFDLTENEKNQIGHINILGTFSKDESFYQNLFYKYASDQIKNRIFIKKDIDAAAKNLIIALKNKGYIKAQLKKIDIQKEFIKSTNRKSSASNTINLTLEEGPQTVITEINFKGNKSLSKDELIKSMNLTSNHFLDLNELEAGLNDLKAYYNSLGFLEMQLTNMTDGQFIKYNDDFSQASIDLVVEEGPQILVGSILIEGNTLTHEKVILSELEFTINDVATPKKLEESIARLQKTGLFSSTEIKMLETNTTLAKRTFVISILERKPGLVTAGIGITNENNYTFHGYAGLAYRNLGGWGRGFSIRGDGSYNPSFINFIENKITIGYLEPYLFDTRLRFRINYTTSRNVSDFTIRQKTITNQAIWSLEKDFTSNITGIWQIYNIANFVDEGITPDDEIKYNYSRNDLVIASTGPTIDLDYRNDLINPTEGHFSRMSLDYATRFLGSHKSDDFIRLTAQSTLYTDFFQRLVWANSIRFGYLLPLKSNDEGVRFDKKGFSLGGRTTIRGFESNEFFPNTDTLGAKFKIQDPSSYQLVKSEFRFPFFEKSDFSGALFYDGGQVYLENIDPTLGYKSEWRDSAGIGIRYNLPIGPLSLEYAQKLNRKNEESSGAFHLSVGVF